MQHGDEFDNPRLASNQRLARQAEENEVIDISGIAGDAKIALDELIQRIQVDQRIELRQQVSNRDSNWLAVIGKQHHRIDKATILDLAFDHPTQDVAVNAVEELSNVQLERIAVTRTGLQCGLRIVGGLVRAHAGATGKRLVDESAIKDRSSHGIDGVLYHQITEGWRVDAPRLWLIDHETVIRARLVTAIGQLTMQRIEIASQMLFKIEARTLAVLVPCSGMERRQ